MQIMRLLLGIMRCTATDMGAIVTSRVRSSQFYAHLPQIASGGGAGCGRTMRQRSGMAHENDSLGRGIEPRA
jgi:hypothetical protein